MAVSTEPMLLDVVRQRIHLEKVRAIHSRDLAGDFLRVCLSPALVRKYPNATSERTWLFVFPAASCIRDPATGHIVKHQRNEKKRFSGIRDAVKAL